MPETTASPETLGRPKEPPSPPLYHVVLLDDNEHTHEYVVEMLGNIFCLSVEDAFRKAEEVHHKGHTIVVTCELPVAEYGRDQIHAYGADRRLPTCKGSMRARIEPAIPN